jgi:hypothetical protein
MEDVLMTRHQQIFAVVTSSILFLFILELVRRRRLREEYSWLWLLTGAVMLLLVVWQQLLLVITRIIGAVSPITTLMLFSLLFLLSIAIHYSMIISRLTAQIKDLVQELALLDDQLERRRPG